MIFTRQPHQKDLKDKNSLMGMYASFAMLVFIVFGLAGTKSNWNGTQAYSKKNADLKAIEQRVDAKKKYLTQTEQTLNKNLVKENSIEAMIPQGGEFEQYVEEIVAANSGYGFDVEKVSFTTEVQDINAGSASVSITFGTEDTNPDLEGLVKSLEKTPRLSIIDGLAYSTVGEKQTLKVNLTIYLIK